MFVIKNGKNLYLYCKQKYLCVREYRCCMCHSLLLYPSDWVWIVPQTDILITLRAAVINSVNKKSDIQTDDFNKLQNGSLRTLTLLTDDFNK